jgi:hypothetical protein
VEQNDDQKQRVADTLVFQCLQHTLNLPNEQWRVLDNAHRKRNMAEYENVCVATLINGGITVISPDGARVEHIPMPDRYTTNICFGGPQLRTAFITLSMSGRLVATEWPRPGLALQYLNR